MNQFVAPRVSQKKFDRVLSDYRLAERHQSARGWWLMWAEFPQMLFAFVATKVKPPSVVFGALLDFTNYDVWPPSVRIVDPFSGVTYRKSQLPVHLNRRVSPEGTEPIVVGTLVQVHKDEIPFVCLPGIREYHHHPAHSGDHWFLIRNTPAGAAVALLEQLYKYGAAPINGMQVQLQFNISGFTQEEIPT